jgi:uncharacterized membrane protein
MVPNGNLAHVLLFGLFAGFALAGMPMIDRRRRALAGPDVWNRLAARTSAIPLAALLEGRWQPDLRALPIPRLLAGLGAYALLFALHGAVIGVSPAPFPV